MSTLPMSLSPHSDTEYSDIIDKYAKVSKKKRKPLGREHDDSSARQVAGDPETDTPSSSGTSTRETLKSMLGDRRAVSSFSVFPACKQVERERAQDDDHKVFHQQCDYHSYAAVPQDAAASQKRHSDTAPLGHIFRKCCRYRDLVLTIGSFYKLRTSPLEDYWRWPPSFTLL